MLILQPNGTNIFGRVIMLGIAILMIFLFINYGLKEPDNEQVIFWKIKVVYILYFVIAVFAFLTLTISISLLNIIKVQADNNTQAITFIYLLYKKTISTNDINNYFVTLHRNRSKVFYGLLLNLKDNKKIQLTDQNIKSLSKFKEYLIDKHIPYLGERKMKFPFN